MIIPLLCFSHQFPKISALFESACLIRRMAEDISKYASIAVTISAIALEHYKLS
jgi:hypothetical protein